MDSPVSDRSDLTFKTLLTPRSKVKALLAQLDADSDNDDGSSDTPDAYEAGSPLVLPRGRLAARLKSASLHKSTTSHDTGSSPNERNLHADAVVSKIHQPSSPDPPALKRRLFTKTKDGRRASPRALEFSSRSRPEPAETVPSNSVTNDDDNQIEQSPVHDLVGSVSDAMLVADTEGAAPNELAGGRDNSRFLELVAKKRAEREARENAEEEARNIRAQQLQQSSDRLDELLEQDGENDAEDPATGDAMLSQLKPSRRAGKKALEALNRETQRLTRNQQLAHAATTRKKYSVADLFSRFGASGSVSKPASEMIQQEVPSSEPASPKSSSQVEGEAATPPTSPTAPDRYTRDISPEPKPFTVDPVQLARGNDGDESQLKSAPVEDEVPSVDKLFDTILASTDNMSTVDCDPVIAPILTGARRQDIKNPANTSSSTFQEMRQPNFRIQPLKLAATNRATSEDSEDDLDIAVPDEIVGRLARFLDRPLREARADNKSRLQYLAHLSSQSKRTGPSAKQNVPITQMYTNLMAQARKQAALQRSERIEELRAKGVVIQTAEEREKDQMVTEDLLEKARKENEELTKREQEERRRGGETTDLTELDDSDDESYLASSDEQLPNDSDAEDELDEENDDVEYSGSEDEQEQGEQADTSIPGLNFFEEEAPEDESGPVNLEAPVNSRVEDSQDDEMPVRRQRRGRAHRVLDDDDDDDDKIANDDENEVDRPSKLTPEPSFPTIINPFARGPQIGGAGTSMPMGLSQAFAATMDDDHSDDNDLEQFSAVLTPQVPEPNLPVHKADQIIRSGAKSKSLDLVLTGLTGTQHEPVTQGTPFDGTQLSEMPEPTQDMGISTASPVAERFTTVQPSTIDTVILPHAANIAQTDAKKKGRIIRGRVDTSGMSSDEGIPPTSFSLNNAFADVGASSASQDVASDAFQAMKKAERRRAQAEAFNKKKSNAKQMIEEQAEESEDEYAGLGGASDDDSGGELDDETRKMVNDEQVNLNESELAAYHADKERADDDKAVRKLLTDIESGMLRRKRGGNGAFDELSDSEDERQERLLRARQDRESRQRKALLLDENLGKIAENPKKAAFLAAVEDRRGEVESSFLDDAVPAPALLRNDSVDEIPDSQPQGDVEGSSYQRIAGEKRKRPLEELDPNKRAPFSNRRTHRLAGNKPQSLAEIRETLSFLIEEPHERSDVQVAATQASDAEEEMSASRFADRRRKNSVVDRLFLKRAESTETTKSTSRGRLAFHTRTSDDQGLTMPSLLRRATTQNTGDAQDVVYASERAAGGKNRADRDQIRRGGTKKSSVAYFAREADRRKAVDKVEKRKDLELRKATEGRRGMLRGLHGGTFE